MLIAVFCLLSSALAQTSNPIIPRRAIFSDADKSIVSISPDGKTISYRAPLNGVMNIWTGPVREPSKAEPLTREAEAPILNYQWAYTGRHIIYLKPADKGVHLFALDLEQGKSRDLTPLGEVSVRIERLSADLPEEALISLNNRDPQKRDLHRINLLTGDMKLVLKNEEYQSFMCDDQFRPRVARRATLDGGYELFRLNGKSEWETFIKINQDDSRPSQPVSLDKSGRILYMTDSSDHDTAVLKAIDIQTGRASVLIEDRLADLVPTLMIHPKTSRVQSATAYFGRMRRHYIDKTIASDFTYLNTLRKGDVGVAGRSLDDNMWLVVYLDGGPLHYYAYDRRAKRAWSLFTDNAALSDYRLAVRREVVVTARDGLKFPGDLYLPVTEDGKTAKGPLPMLIYVHGGPSVAYPWNSWYTNRIIQLLANRGYAVLRAEFRGTGGLGKKIMYAGDLEWGRKMHLDLLDAADWAVKEGIADPKRIAIYGWSYGGYATLAALAFTPDRFACGMSLYPVSDLELLINGSDPLSARVWRRRLGDNTDEKGLALVKGSSPVHSVKHITKPLLITHGAKDRIAVREHSDRFVEEMRKHHKPVTYLLYPDEGHDYVRNENWISFFAVAERFLHEHLGGRFEPVGEDLASANFEILEGARLIPGLIEARRPGRGGQRSGVGRS